MAIAGRRSAGGNALSAFGRKPVLNRIEGRSHLPRSQESGLGAEKRLDGTVREDTLLVNETEWPAIVGVCHMEMSDKATERLRMAAGQNGKNRSAALDLRDGAGAWMPGVVFRHDLLPSKAKGRVDHRAC
jgi:hypothetical protein